MLSIRALSFIGLFPHWSQANLTLCDDLSSHIGNLVDFS